MKTASGATKVSLDISSRGLIIEGNKHAPAKAADFLAQLAQRFLVGQPTSAGGTTAAVNAATAVDSEAVCPVCLCVAGDDDDDDDVDDVKGLKIKTAKTVQLECSHLYCRACFQLLLTQITDGDSSCGSKFPITCYAGNPP